MKLRYCVCFKGCLLIVRCIATMQAIQNLNCTYAGIKIPPNPACWVCLNYSFGADADCVSAALTSPATVLHPAPPPATVPKSTSAWRGEAVCAIGRIGGQKSPAQQAGQQLGCKQGVMICGFICEIPWCLISQ